MAQINIEKEIKATTLKLSKLEDLQETYLKLKNKYNNLEIFCDDNEYNFYINNNNISVNNNYNFEYSVKWANNSPGSLCVDRKILDKEYSIVIGTYHEIEILEIYYRHRQVHFVWDYYNLPSGVILKIESSIINQLINIQSKIINKTQSKKVQQFIDNLIFM